MKFIDELKWRGMLHDSTPGVEKLLDKGSATAYIGFDPTAPSLTIGNYVQVMLLSLFQRSGHTPIFLMGGATGRIGDPSGKDKERQLKSYEELDANLAAQVKQAEKFLNFEDGPNKAILKNNLDFYKDMNILDFLRKVGKNLTINYMMSKESVKKRVETGLSFTEFSYQLLQAYDYLCLYRDNNCKIQMGGSDQWGNITSGTEFIRRNEEAGKAYAITTPLLTKSDGSKFGKSEEGNIWLDPKMTTPYKFYQFWINADDADLAKYMRYFTFKSEAEVIANEKENADNPNMLKKMLAEELTVRIHSEEAYHAVLNVSEILFNKNANKDQLMALDEDALHTVGQEITSFELDRTLIQNGVNVVDLISEHTEIVKSKGDARRAIQNNALAVNKDKIASHEVIINHEALLHGKYLMVENGKKNKFLISVN